MACGLCATIIFAASWAAFAQAGEPDKNRMVFPPGAKVPLGTDEASTGQEASGQAAASSSAAGVSAAPVPTPEESIRLFFLALEADNIEGAYDNLVRDTIIADRKEDIKDLKRRTLEALDSYGPVAGYEVIDSRTVGQNLARKTCLSLNTDLPLRWRFYFYRSGGNWRLVDLRVDDGLVELFEDSARSR